MHEVDPQSETRLTDALKRLAASSPQSAPPEIAADLLNEFRRHHAHRRLQRAGILGLAICLAATAALVSMRNSGQKPPEAAKQAVPSKQALPARQPEPEARIPVHETTTASAAPRRIASLVPRPAV